MKIKPALEVFLWESLFLRRERDYNNTFPFHIFFRLLFVYSSFISLRVVFFKVIMYKIVMTR